MSVLFSLYLTFCKACTADLESVCIVTGPSPFSSEKFRACRIATSSVCMVEAPLDVLQEAVKTVENTADPEVEVSGSTVPSV